METTNHRAAESCAVHVTVLVFCLVGAAASGKVLPDAGAQAAGATGPSTASTAVASNVTTLPLAESASTTMSAGSASTGGVASTRAGD